MIPTHSGRSLSVEPRCHDSINRVYNSLCLTIFYLHEIWLLVSLYLVQSCSWQVLFTRTVIQYHLVIKLINHVLASGVIYCIAEWVWSISLCHMEGQIPILIHAPQQVLFDTQETPLWSLSYQVTFDDLNAFFWYPRVTLSHGLKNMIVDIIKATAIEQVTWSDCCD
jgi:hypothetical protein